MKNEIEQLKKRIKKLEEQLIEEQFAKPNTKEEWKEFGQVWLDGGYNKLQWIDTSEGADAEWFDLDEDDAWYPYDERVIYRYKND